MTQNKFYGLKYDSVFKNVFYRDKEIIVREFLLNLELTKDRFYIKNKTVDIRVDTGDNIINCEINLSYDKETKIRNFCFISSS